MQKMGIEKTSAVVFAIGMALFVIVIGLGYLGVLPFAFTGVEQLVFVLLLIAAILAVEVFREERIRSLKQLTEKPFAMMEAVFIGVIVVVSMWLMVMQTIPAAMEPLVGVICLISGVLMVLELKH